MPLFTTTAIYAKGIYTEKHHWTIEFNDEHEALDHTKRTYELHVPPGSIWTVEKAVPIEEKCWMKFFRYEGGILTFIERYKMQPNKIKIISHHDDRPLPYTVFYWAPEELAPEW
jgi:hypothetical protein